MEEQELNRRVEEEAAEARKRWFGSQESGRTWGHLSNGEQADWRRAVRPLVERIVEMETVPAKVDAAQGETLIKRVGREVGPALDRWQSCNDGNHNSMRAAIGPLVAANMGLEDERDSARESAEVLAERLTAAQTAGRDQASEIQRLKLYVDALKADLDVARAALPDDAEIERLTTTIDVLAGRLAARGQS